MVKLLVCGDFVSQNPKDIIVDSHLKELFSQQDFIAVNFEAPIRGMGTPIMKSGPSLTQSVDSPSFLENLGVNIILMANNHMMDQGKIGLTETSKLFSNVIRLGAGSLDDSYKLTVLQKGKLRIGLLCATHKEFGVLNQCSQPEDFGTAWINHPRINLEIIKAKNSCDVLIVLPHAGVEDMLVPLPEWRSRYKEFIDLGADVVIASHPHTPQGWESYKGKKIYYSLGNFFFQLFSSQHGENWFKGLLVEMEIGDDKNISFKVYNTKFSDTSISLDKSEESQSYNNYLLDLLNDDAKYWNYLNRSLLELWPEYKLYILRGLSAVTPRSNMHVLLHAGYGLLKGNDLPMLLNNFQCESHCWAIERMLNLQLINKK